MHPTQPTDDEILALDAYFRSHGLSAELEDFATRVRQVAGVICAERRADEGSKV